MTLAYRRLVVASLILTLLPGQNLLACPFCSAVSQTLRQEMAAMDTVAIARILPGSINDSEATFSVESVLRGDKLVRPDQELLINYFGKPKDEQRFVIMGVDPPDLLWSSPLPVSEVAAKYIESIQTLPDDSLKRLKFYMDYLEHEDALLARDAYDEFASAPYSEIKELEPKMDKGQLLGWIQDTSLPPDRKRLYLVMLGVCGDKGDADLLAKMLVSKDPAERGGLDAMIACYATLKGEKGLDLIDAKFLKNKDCQYADTYAAIMALRFHGTEGGVIKKERILKSMRLILDRPELADLVIPDLARWEDWSQIDKLEKLFSGADEKSSWVRVPVINYLRACPLPEAAEALKRLKEIDPAAYKRATSFFPMPKASSESSTDGTSTLDPARVKGIATDSPLRVHGQSEVQLALADASGDQRVGNLLPDVGQPANRFSVVSVLAMASVTLWLAMWLSVSGAGNSPILRLLNRFEK
ncbi:MAG: hypothetical protein AB8B50_10255 [Pirellulaceae bacterium]